MEGAEHFDFFRQPDFLKDTFLAGSYAVYKKETLLGEGTGKLCHIHRPEIIDAQGRRCWGDLALADNELRITIPETFLSEAAYPVIVDPTVGTATVGSQYKFDLGYEQQPPQDQLLFEVCIPVNQFQPTEKLSGTVNAYFYTNEDDYEAYGLPVVYSDNKNKPSARLSSSEQVVNLRVNPQSPAGWRNAPFAIGESIKAGDKIGFGLFVKNIWCPRFDYGELCYADWWWDYDDGGGPAIPDSYPLSNPPLSHNLKLSMYFTYSSAQHYTRTLTQGVNLPDCNYRDVFFRRSVLHLAHISGLVLSQKGHLLKQLVFELVNCPQAITRKAEIRRRKQESAAVKSLNVAGFSLKRFIKDGAEALSLLVYHQGVVLVRFIVERVKLITFSKRKHAVILRILDNGVLFDFNIKRFLISKNEIIIKSPVYREIEIESRV
jgi:hypothetical protein